MKMHTRKAVKWDCLKIYFIPVLFYASANMAGELLHIYSAAMMGGFADTVLEGDYAVGIGCLQKILVSVGASIAIPVLAETLGEVTMFSASLKHGCMVLDGYMKKTYRAACKIQEGEAQYRLEDDQNELGITWVDILSKGISLPFVTAYLMYHALSISAWFTAVVFAVSLLKLAAPIAVKGILEKYDMQEREGREGIRALENQMLKQPCEIRLLGLQEHMQKRLQAALHEFTSKTVIKKARCEVFAEQATAGLSTFCMLAILFAGAAAVSLGKLSVGAIAAMAGYFYVFHIVIEYAASIIQNLAPCKNLIGRIAIFYEGWEDVSGMDAGCAEGSGHKESSGRIESLELVDLTFSYGDEAVISHLSKKIRLQAKTAICGRNGSGKSTLLKAMCGLYPECFGGIRINGRSLRQIGAESWRKKFAYVEQSPFLFKGTVKENVRLGKPEAPDAWVDAVMQQLGIADLANREVLNSRQSGLSGGERQKIAIARALLKDAGLLFMDEPGNHLDGASLAWLEGFVRDYAGTVIFISHARGTLALADDVVELDG